MATDITEALRPRAAAPPVPPGHKKKSGKTVPAPAPQSEQYGRKTGTEKGGLPSRHGPFPALPPPPRERRD